jgi:hypothetical protein
MIDAEAENERCTQSQEYLSDYLGSLRSNPAKQRGRVWWRFRPPDGTALQPHSFQGRGLL